jgi:ribonuclease PH
VLVRSYNRGPHDMRPLSVAYGVYPYADGSVLIALGATRVLVGITLQNGVPQFLRGKGGGWLQAEYALMPLATHSRVARESSAPVRSGRSVEISRMIGRVFRSVISLRPLGERTITIDCDVLQADGSTRVAAINGVTLALRKAQDVWLSKKIITKPVIKDAVAAVSLGVLPLGYHDQERCLVDLDYHEDSLVDADFTFILTRESIVEVHGGAERAPVSWHHYATICERARAHADLMLTYFETSLQQSSSLVDIRLVPQEVDLS